MRLEVGYNGELLAAPLSLLNNVTPSWIKHVWVSTQEADVLVSMDFTEVPFQHHSDIELMQLFVQTGWKQPDLHTLNHCRMFLRVFLLSDIVAGSGDFISPAFWDRPSLVELDLDWPRTQAPPQSTWLLWKSALASALHLGRNQRLALPLGQWYAQHQPRGWFYHPTTNSLWEATSTQWIQHGGIPQRTRQCWFHGTGCSEYLPPLLELHKASIARHGQKLCLTRYDACEEALTNQDFCQWLRSVEFSLQWGLSVQQTGGQQTLLQTLSQGQGYAVSDGSYKDEMGAAAWIIEGPTLALRLTGQIYTPSHSMDHSSFRSKLSGIVGVLYTLTFWPPMLNKPTFWLACDSLSVIN